MAFALFLSFFFFILLGYPVALTLAGVSMIFLFIGIATNTFDWSFLQILNSRLYGIITNSTLIAVPLFVLMGVTLQHSKIAEALLLRTAILFSWLRGDLGIAVILIGMLLAASTGIVGATVVTMGLLSLPVMLKRGYDPCISSGIICASGTLGQIIPPSIVLILLGDVMSSAYQQAQLAQGIFAPESVSVIDLFAGAIIPGLILVALYLVYINAVAICKPELMPQASFSGKRKKESLTTLLKVFFAPLFLIIAVLGSILGGIATPTEAASFGAVGALILTALNKELSIANLKKITQSSARITAMVFLILIGASIFAFCFRGFGGDEIVHQTLEQLPGGVVAAVLLTMIIMFLLGFILDFIEITLIVVPLVAPALLAMGLNPVWLGVMIAINLQTSFLTPPFGFSLFYLRGVAASTVTTKQIYIGVIPFIALQLLTLGILAIWPELATWLPQALF